MKRTVLALCSAFFLLLATGAQAAAPTIVNAAFIVDAMKRGVLIWDVRSAEEYRKGHLPGAVNIGDAAKVLRDDNTEDFLPVDRIEKILGAGGIDPSREVVVYAGRGQWNAYFGWYALRHFGGDRVHVYHDGIDGWRDAGQAISTEGAKPTPVALKLQANPEVIATTQQVRAALGRSDVQLVDARTAKEFLGEDIRAIRGGHIPGAVNIPYEQNWADPDTLQKLARRQAPNNQGLSLKTEEQLRAVYAKLDPSKETIVYCQSGARASETAAVLQDLGFKRVKVYDSSWLGYGNTLDAPANNATFFNVGLMNNRMAVLQQRIDALERQLAEAKAAK
jgi:thiosulfate/3-mercaptopyruvate sulfurtransferase